MRDLFEAFLTLLFNLFIMICTMILLGGIVLAVSDDPDTQLNNLQDCTVEAEQQFQCIPEGYEDD